METKNIRTSINTWLYPLLTFGCLVLIWWFASARGYLSEQFFPTPAAFVTGFREEVASGSLFRDTLASLSRVAAGYAISVVFGVPLGMILGTVLGTRLALLPLMNFLRSLSPLAWIP
ncbi:MAG: ABC transporter permease, partial [Armatimonadaceae bacterium]